MACKIIKLDLLDPHILCEEVKIYSSFQREYIFESEQKSITIQELSPLNLAQQLPKTNDCGIYCLEYIDCALKNIPFQYDKFVKDLKSIKMENKAYK